MADSTANKEKSLFLTGHRQNTKQIMLTAQKLNQKLKPNMLRGDNNIKQVSDNKINFFAPRCLLHRKNTLNRSNISHALSVGKPKPAKAE
jgi:hypothetical protein